GVFGGVDIGKAEAGDKRENVDDISPRGRQPSMKVIRASNDAVPLRRLARRFRRNRIPEHLAAVVRVHARLVYLCVGGGHVYSMRAGAKLTRERRHVDLGAAEAVGMVPTGGLNDLHRSSAA